MTPNFTIEEFDCNDGTKVPEEYIPALRYLCNTFLEPMRKKFGPATVNSGYRTPAYNARIGGARFSFHVYIDRERQDGVAADVRFKRGSVAQWRAKAQRIRLLKRKGKGGIGYYPRGGFIHIDTRDYKADWDGP